MLHDSNQIANDLRQMLFNVLETKIDSLAGISLKLRPEEVKRFV